HGRARALPGRRDQPRGTELSAADCMAGQHGALHGVVRPGAHGECPARARRRPVRVEHAAARSLRRLHADLCQRAPGILRTLGAGGCEARGTVARLSRRGRGYLLHDGHRCALQPARLDLRGPCARHVLARQVARRDPRRAGGPGQGGPAAFDGDHMGDARPPARSNSRSDSMMRAKEASTESGSVRQRTLEILQQVTGDADVLTDPDLQLYGSGLLDSLATVSLIVAFEDAFGLVISPAEFDRDAWATPELLVADIERRLAEGAAAWATQRPSSAPSSGCA